MKSNKITLEKSKEKNFKDEAYGNSCLHANEMNNADETKEICKTFISL